MCTKLEWVLLLIIFAETILIVALAAT
jgi:hypothetical protein